VDEYLSATNRLNANNILFNLLQEERVEEVDGGLPGGGKVGEGCQIEDEPNEKRTILCWCLPLQ
jgi:hypothetical protein